MAEATPLISADDKEGSFHDQYGSVGERPGSTDFNFARPGMLPHDGEAKLSRDASVHVTDEVFNTASHFAAAMVSFLGSVVLIVKASLQKEPWKIVGFTVYGATLVALFMCSTLHHGLEGSPAMEKALRIADFCAIFPLIAGTFTPLCLVYLNNTGVGWTFFGVLWFLTACGIGLVISTWDKLPKWVPFTMYITMGWMGALLAKVLFPFIGWAGVGWLALGGVCFSVGGVMYQMEMPNPVPGRFGFHEIWHCMVILGALCHYMLMYDIVAPATPV